MIPKIERIVGVALVFSHDRDGLIAMDAPARHHDLIRQAQGHFTLEAIALAEQGFVTNTGWFVSRHAALRIADKAGQIIRRTAPDHGLFSEDVW